MSAATPSCTRHGERSLRWCLLIECLLVPLACGEGAPASTDGARDVSAAGAGGEPPSSREDCALWYREGHGDLFVVFDGELTWRIRSAFGPGTPETLADPSEVCVVVPGASYALARAMGGAPASEDYAFLGAAAGQAFWLLPQAPRDGMPWFGASTEDVPSSTYDEDAVELEITDVEMPEGGNLAAFSSGTFGAPSVIFSTAAGKLEHSFRTGVHLHFNWAFTVEGTYTVSLRLAAERAGVRETSAPNFVRVLVQP